MIYEVRTYTLKPGTVTEFEARFEKRHPYRERHSKLGAFWHTEMGPLNQLVHVWPYEDLQHRTAAREAANRDPDLQRTPTGREFIVAQESEIMIPAPGNFMLTELALTAAFVNHPRESTFFALPFEQ